MWNSKSHICVLNTVYPSLFCIVYHIDKPFPHPVSAYGNGAELCIIKVQLPYLHFILCNNLWKKLLFTWGDTVLSIRIWKWNIKWRKDSILDQRVAVGWCNIWLALTVWHLGFLFQWPLWWRCCVSPWLTHILIMLTCTLTTNQYYYSCFSVHTRYIVLNISSFSHSHPNTSGVDHSDAELWHFTCTSKSGYIIQLSGISKGHNLYLFIWCLQCQCFFVQHEFLRGRCQRSRPCWGCSAPPINSQQAFCELFCVPLLWSRRPNLWPYSLLNRLQNYSSSRSVKRCAGAQQGHSDKAIGTKAREKTPQ